MFKKIKETNENIKKRVLAHGVGINDAPYKLTYVHKGKRTYCPRIAQWKRGIFACLVEKKSEYMGAKFKTSWVKFSVFDEEFIAPDRSYSLKANKNQRMAFKSYPDQKEPDLVAEKKKIVNAEKQRKLVIKKALDKIREDKRMQAATDWLWQ